MDLNFKTFGQGPALIILHGLFGSLDNWVSHARQLADTYSVYLIDQRNHGKSPHSDQWDYSIMADDLLDFMDQQGIYQAHLLGHSMGGKVVMVAAGRQPDRVDKLIVADMAPKSYPPHHTQILETLIHTDLTALTSRKEAKEHLSKGIPEIGVQQFLLKGLGRDDEGNFAWKFNLPVIYDNYSKVLEAVQPEETFDGPTLFISGGKSNYVQMEDHAEILDFFPNAEFEILENAGHWIHAESPQEFITSTRNFLG